MISKAVYVQCDYCGDPAPITVEGGAKEARRLAQVEDGFVRKGGRDLCPRCAQSTDTPLAPSPQETERG